MSKPQIQPRVLKGFRDLLPSASIPRRQMVNTIERVFSSFGFVPIETPALEYADILLGKGSEETDKQMYRFLDNGERDVALRFDLTVPLARYAAMYIHELGTPFKRYHIAPVWRAEKPQRGRYREFVQCDVDIIGTTSMLADAEIVAVIGTTLKELGIAFETRLNNRMILNGLLDTLGAKESSTAVLRAIDKLDKLEAAAVKEELREAAKLTPDKIERIFEFLSLAKSNSGGNSILEELSSFLADSPLALQGIEQLRNVMEALRAYELSDSKFVVDISIARGLDYYTSTVFETVLTDLPSIGSISSGGRYDNLAELYTKQQLPGVGCSIGLDRIIGAYEELGRLAKKSTTADVLVTLMDSKLSTTMVKLATQLRQAAIPTELYTEQAKLGAQLKYAARKGIPIAVIAGESELEQDQCSIKMLEKGEQIDNIPFNELVSQILKALQAD